MISMDFYRVFRVRFEGLIVATLTQITLDYNYFKNNTSLNAKSNNLLHHRWVDGEYILLHAMIYKQQGSKRGLKSSKTILNLNYAA